MTVTNEIVSLLFFVSFQEVEDGTCASPNLLGSSCDGIGFVVGSNLVARVADQPTVGEKILNNNAISKM